MGVLHVILVISLVGYVLVRTAFYSGGSSRRGRSFPVHIMLLGVGLICIGAIGVFFGRLIKAAVSRQREYLADSASVQFTRNPSGLAGALKKIGGYALGSRIRSPRAEEASHMYFGNGLRASIFDLLATHPPLHLRIKRLEPSFNGTYPCVGPVSATAREAEFKRPTPKSHLEAIRRRREAAAGGERMPFDPGTALAAIGTIAATQLEYAASLRQAVPEPVAGEVRNPFGARAVVCGMLLDEDSRVRQRQWQALQEHADPRVLEILQRLQPHLTTLGPALRLPLAAMAMPALRGLSDSQFKSFCDLVQRLAKADEKINLFEYCLHRLILNSLTPHFGLAPRRLVQYYDLKAVGNDCRLLLSALAYAGQRDTAAAERAFAAGCAKLRTGRRELKFDLLPRSQLRLELIDTALDRLAQSSPAIKRIVLDACATMVEADGRITVQEFELLRTIADTLDCPMPPVLPESVRNQ